MTGVRAVPKRRTRTVGRERRVLTQKKEDRSMKRMISMDEVDDILSRADAESYNRFDEETEEMNETEEQQ